MSAEPAPPRKALGQHWLNDRAALKAICDAAEITGQDTVLEIGPGTGTLTRELLKRAGQVIAVEKDEQLLEQLKTTFSPQEIAPPAGGKLQFVSGDILQFDLSGLPAGYKIVANIPYYLTSNLIRTLSESANPPARTVILVQKEVAQRVAAQPGDMSLLSVSAQFYWEVSLGLVVPAKLFTPPPKIDSQILVMKRRVKPLFEDVDTKKFFRVVKAGFSSRRKTLLNSLSGGLSLSKPQTLELLKKANIDHACRPQELSLEAWHNLYLNL